LVQFALRWKWNNYAWLYDWSVDWQMLLTPITVRLYVMNIQMYKVNIYYGY